MYYLNPEQYEKLLELSSYDIIFFSVVDNKSEIWIHCSDIFLECTADCTLLDKDDVDKFYDIDKKFQEAGVIAWCAIERNKEPLEGYITEDYKKAKEFILKQKENKSFCYFCNEPMQTKDDTTYQRCINDDCGEFLNAKNKD